LKHVSLIDALTDCSTSCGWCVHQCPDEDKYEMLVTCIRIQKECAAICMMINSILAERASDSTKKIFYVFEILTENLQKSQGTATKNTLRLKDKPEKERKKPGCSKIFQIALFIEQSYLNEQYHQDREIN
jgi:hypothetical protein